MKRIGIVGNGQLGRMLTLEAHRLGLQAVSYGPDLNSPTAQVAPLSFTAPYQDQAKLAEFLKHVDVVTFEFENIPVETLDFLQKRVPVHPTPQVLWICQNREREKAWLKKNNFPTIPFRLIGSPEELATLPKLFSYPFVVKTTGFGYDGKGQTKISDENDIKNFKWTASSFVAEKWITDVKEGSVIVARNEKGVRTLGPFENVHHKQILDHNFFPSSFTFNEIKDMKKIALGIAEAFALKGILCVEFFVDSKNNQIMVNEMAPRPHNSGHLTIEGFQTSQYEHQIRAILGEPLGSEEMISPCATANLLGDLWDGRLISLNLFPQDKTYFHWYGKKEARLGRKMGHLTSLGETPTAALFTVLSARNKIAGIK